VALRRTDYDREAAAARIRAATGAETDDFVRENLLAVPTAEEAFAFFAAHGGPDPAQATPGSRAPLYAARFRASTRPWCSNPILL